MTSWGEIREWMFTGLALETVLDELETEGLSVRASTNPGALQRVIPLEEFPPDVRRAAMQTLPAFLAFFSLENAVRSLVTDRLSENHGAGWWTTCVPKAVQDRVAQREAKEGKNRWHIARGAQEIFYTDFGDLLTLIQNNWTDFEDLFPDQHWVANRLNDLEASRNIIAHSNTLDEREVTRIKMYLQDWLRQVG
jgi:hypothetical protein